MIIYPNLPLIPAFKFMYNFSIDTLLISRGRNQHKYIHHEYKQKMEIPTFNDWARFVHLQEEDFKTDKKERLLCVRPTYHDKIKIQGFIDSIQITSPIVWDATNEVLIKLTKNYKEKY